MSCLDDNVLLAFVEGALDAPQAGEALAHLDACNECRELYAEVARAEGEASRATAAKVHEPGSKIGGRYVLEEALGAGAVGVVYRAFDETLRRKVALKLVRPRGDETSRERLLTRVRREARAMAKLAHPNVVAVYDVGTHDDDVFVTMELVAGTTLTEAVRGRKVRDVLALFRLAGEGLAAAHAAGLVHRDFKPDNVLVDDGVVKVGDFGIAREAGTGAAIAALDDGAITHGAVGTPAYMAPEQMRGEPVDARADVFAYSVALYEALHGVRPFAGRTPAELLAAIERGGTLGVETARVPARVRSAIMSGLAASRDARTPSMRALLHALRPRADRTRIALGALVAVVVGGGVAAWARGSDTLAHASPSAPKSLDTTVVTARVLGASRVVSAPDVVAPSIQTTRFVASTPGTIAAPPESAPSASPPPSSSSDLFGDPR